MYAIAFMTGMISSLHCLGMCGPLALSIPGFGAKGKRVLEKIAYNMGRILTYGSLGLLVGILGRKLWIIGFQQRLSIVIGLVILILSFLRFRKISLEENRFLMLFIAPIQNLLIYALSHKSGPFLIGVLNGLLPCGFVYMALVESLNSGSIGNAALFMVLFGLGTLPLMLALMLGGGFLNPFLRQRLSKTIPYWMVFLGIWFILRGLNLSIPYLSPGKLSWGLSICR